MGTANRRLKQVQSILLGVSDSDWKQLLILPDDARVSVLEPQSGSPEGSSTRIAIDRTSVLDFRPLPRELALILSALGTPFEKSSPDPRYPVLELSAVDNQIGRASCRERVCLYV